MSLATFTRGKIAKLTGCSPETIRYYERIGLLPEPLRSDNGYRRYTQDHVSRLHFIQRAKQLGFSNDDIRELLSISDGPDTRTRAEVKDLTENHIALIQHRIDELGRMEKTLRQIAEQCDGANEGPDHCPILRSLFDETILFDSDDTVR